MIWQMVKVTRLMHATPAKADGESLPHRRSIQLRDQVGFPAANAERFERKRAPLTLAQAERRRAGDLPDILLANTHR